MRAPLTACLILLAAAALTQPARAQSADPDQALATCTEGLDVGAITARAEAYAASQDYDAHINDLCTAGDSAGANAFQARVQAEIEARDPDAARMTACLVAALGKQAVDPGDVCAID